MEIHQELLPAHHPGQSSYIWLIETDVRSLIVRSSRVGLPVDEDFSQGTLRLFDSSVREADRLESINNWFKRKSRWPVPKVYSVRQHNQRTFVIVEKMFGTSLKSFNDLKPESLVHLGWHIAQLHQHHFSHFGSHHVLGIPAWGHPQSQFLSRLFATIQYLAHTYHGIHDRVPANVLSIASKVSTLPSPRWFTPLMLDMDPSQFLQADGDFTACIDTEYYVVGPPSLELVGLEYLLSEESAQAFLAGYERVAPMPSLKPYREVFRLLLRLLSFQGPVPWDPWMNAPERFNR